MLTMLHANPAVLENNTLRVDRKFLLGMEVYAKSLAVPITTVHPEAEPGAMIMDSVSVPLAELPYQVMVLKTDRSWRPMPAEQARLRNQLTASRLVYGGGFGAPQLCRELRVPYILVLEYDLLTQIVNSTSQVSSPLRKLIRILRRTLSYAREIPTISRAIQLHCNGYPIYLETRHYNRNRLLYLDSRMSKDDIIHEDDLRRRLDSNACRPLRLLYSGRFEPLKGALDSVRVALECIRMGIEIEMHCYGQGSLRDDMSRLANDSGGGRIVIHDAIPYPDLLRKSRGFDIFVCCHVQNDPSCTYLESFGSGLPIVGYANRMWRHLQHHSKVGFAVPLRNYQLLAARIGEYARERNLLAQHSYMARAFAVEHDFESEFKRRTDDINVHLSIS